MFRKRRKKSLRKCSGREEDEDLKRKSIRKKNFFFKYLPSFRKRRKKSLRKCSGREEKVDGQ